MFSQVSMAGVGSLITLIEGALLFFGFQVPGGTVGAAINGLITFLGLVWLVWGQARRKDIVGWLFRKQV